MTSRLNNDDDVKEQNRAVSDYSFISDLPDSLLLEIFYRVPIKDVLRCNCVCASWNKLICNPKFSDNYAKKSPYTALLNCTADDSPVVDLIEISENGDYIRSGIVSSLLDWTVDCPVTIVGLCNGFLCMKLYIDAFDFVFVTNPIMGEIIQLPRRYARLDHGEVVHYKFGFSPDLNKFKVLKIGFDSSWCCGIGQCEVLTVGVDEKWRCLRGSFADLPVQCDLVALNGFFHWIPKHEDSEFISTFDLTQETFGRISTPPDVLLVSELSKLAVFGDKLVLVDLSVPSEISICTMKEYAVVESWTNVVISTSWFPSEVRIHNLIPVAELQNGDTLFHDSFTSIISCNIEQKRCLKIDLKVGGRAKTHFLPSYAPNFSSDAKLIMGRGCSFFRSTRYLRSKRLREGNCVHEEEYLSRKLQVRASSNTSGKTSITNCTGAHGLN